MKLDPAAAVGQVEEHRLAVPAPAGDAAAQPHGLAGLGAGLELAEPVAHGADVDAAGEVSGIRVLAALSEPVHLRQPGGPDLGLGVGSLPSDIEGGVYVRPL